MLRRGEDFVLLTEVRRLDQSFFVHTTVSVPQFGQNYGSNSVAP
jgi:hypothetical protein